jgi:hypothetical protein
VSSTGEEPLFLFRRKERSKEKPLGVKKAFRNKRFPARGLHSRFARWFMGSTDRSYARNPLTKNRRTHVNYFILLLILRRAAVKYCTIPIETVKFTLDKPSKSALRNLPRAKRTQKRINTVALESAIVADFDALSRASPAG